MSWVYNLEAKLCPKCGGYLQEVKEKVTDPWGVSDDRYFECLRCKKCGTKVDVWSR